MSYEVAFTKKSNNKEELLGYFRCTSGGYSIVSNLLDVINVSTDWYQGINYPSIVKIMDKMSLGKALEYAESKGPDYYIKNKPCYPIKDVLQEVHDSLSDEDKVEIFLS